MDSEEEVLAARGAHTTSKHGERFILSKYQRTRRGKVETLETSAFFPHGTNASTGLVLDAVDTRDGQVTHMEMVVLDFAEMDRLIELYQQYRKDHECPTTPTN